MRPECGEKKIHAPWRRESRGVDDDETYHLVDKTDLTWAWNMSKN